jgi:hypothetical protein
MRYLLPSRRGGVRRELLHRARRGTASVPVVRCLRHTGRGSAGGGALTALGAAGALGALGSWRRGRGCALASHAYTMKQGEMQRSEHTSTMNLDTSNADVGVEEPRWGCTHLRPAGCLRRRAGRGAASPTCASTPRSCAPCRGTCSPGRTGPRCCPGAPRGSKEKSAIIQSNFRITQTVQSENRQLRITQSKFTVQYIVEVRFPT